MLTALSAVIAEPGSLLAKLSVHGPNRAIAKLETENDDRSELNRASRSLGNVQKFSAKIFARGRCIWRPHAVPPPLPIKPQPLVTAPVVPQTIIGSLGGAVNYCKAWIFAVQSKNKSCSEVAGRVH